MIRGGRGVRGPDAGPTPESVLEVIGQYRVSRGDGRGVAEMVSAVVTHGSGRRSETASDLILLEAESGEVLFLNPIRFREVAVRRGALSPGNREGGAGDAAEAVDLLRLMGGGLDRGWGSAVLKTVSLVRVKGEELEATAKRLCREIASERREDGPPAEPWDTATWLGATALAKAVELQLKGTPGLYRWTGESTGPDGLKPVETADLVGEVADGPFLVFLHGTASSTEGSFGELRRSAAWEQLRQVYGNRILALEHRTMSESPIENALALAEALPSRARVHLVSHSRGGLVGDLFCLDDLEDAEIERWQRLPRTGADAAGMARVEKREREQLRQLSRKLKEKAFVRERYLRVACPARGTLLASANFDVFLSGLLTLVGTVSGLRASGVYGVMTQFVAEVVRRRMDPAVIPGIEAMLPEAPLPALLGRAQRAAGLRMAAVAGDIEGGFWWGWVVALTDWTLFDRHDNDLVVDTESMLGGLLRHGGQALFDQGTAVNHFRYFTNRRTLEALLAWVEDGASGSGSAGRVFSEYTGEPSTGKGMGPGVRGLGEVAGTMGSVGGKRPVVFVVPGIMGSHLSTRRGSVAGGNSQRLWLDTWGLVQGRFGSLKFPEGRVEPEGLLEDFYGDLCRHLSATHDVVPFEYDWRKPIETEAQRLAQRMEAVLKSLGGRQPVRLLAHSMGGLVCRVMIRQSVDTWKRMLAHPGGRFVMLGTPNNGSHLIAQHLVGKADITRTIARIDLTHSLQEILDVVATMPGALQLLPRPNARFVSDPGRMPPDYHSPELWKAMKQASRDFWFGDGVAAVPEEAVLAGAREFWTRHLPDNSVPDPERVLYVFGKASRTAAWVGLESNESGGSRVQILETAAGDGSVTWASGRLDNLPEDQCWWMPAEHGDLPRHVEAFSGLAELLGSGQAGPASGLNRGLPGLARGVAEVLTEFEVGPPMVRDAGELCSGLMGRSVRRSHPGGRVRRVLRISVHAEDLRFTPAPVICGHYLQDPIAGPEAQLDERLLGGELRLRERLGLYPGAVGTAAVVLRGRSAGENDSLERRTGAVVVGLGELGELASEQIAETVRSGVVRFLLELRARDEGALSGGMREVELASLLLGVNSSTSIGLGDSMTAIITGVLTGGQQFAEQCPEARLRIAHLRFVELFLDTATTAAGCRRDALTRLEPLCEATRTRLDWDLRVHEGKGALPRVEAVSLNGYWPRMHVQDADALPGDGSRKVSGRLPDRMQFLFLSQRARAEAVVENQQPGLVRHLVEPMVGQTVRDDSMASMLFQKLVPSRFKDHARAVDRLLLMVDGSTADIPWELMCVDGRPLVERLRLVRQLATTSPALLRPLSEPSSALVVGNPSTSGFGRTFDVGVPDGLPSLEGATREAAEVAEVLRQHGYDAELVPPGASTREVFAALHRRGNRLLHVAAHGISRLKDREGRERSGVVLSDGFQMTAQDIEAFDLMPELVFLNCCHLGRIGVVDSPLPPESQLLAASLALEFVRMGVRCVIVAGWAVDDGAAALFARTFYDAFVGVGQEFGESVFLARLAVLREFPDCNTWGAYQAYGDPTFRLRPCQESGPVRRVSEWVSWRQVAWFLERLKTDLGEQQEPVPAMRRKLEAVLKTIPAELLEPMEVQCLLGDVWTALGEQELARRAYGTAIRQKAGHDALPLHVVEQFLSMAAEPGSGKGPVKSMRSLKRWLDGLDGVQSTGV